jgi:hypothetical protein
MFWKRIYLCYNLDVFRPSLFPGVRVSGRKSSDALGKLQSPLPDIFVLTSCFSSCFLCTGTMGSEVVLMNGGGYQTNTYNRWGDYSCMQVDPSDDTKFWFTTQYVATSGSFNWKTSISSFTFSSTSSPTPSPTTSAPTISPAPTVATASPTHAPSYGPDEFYMSSQGPPVEISYKMNVDAGNGYCGTFEAYGDVTTVNVDFVFGGASGMEYASDMAVGVFAPNGRRIQIGGFDYSYSGVTKSFSFPTSWDTGAAGRYATSVDISKGGANGAGTWEVCVANFYSSANVVSYTGTVSLTTLTAGFAPTPAPTPFCAANAKKLGDGKCDSDSISNSFDCGWDHGDCCEASCKANSNPKVTKNCGKQGYSCKDPLYNTPVPTPAPTISAAPSVSFKPTPSPVPAVCYAQTKKLGDGKCDKGSVNNVAACGYDGGDCCEGSCKANPNSKSVKNCGKKGYECIDPAWA